MKRTIYFLLFLSCVSIYSQENRPPVSCDNITSLNSYIPAIVADAITSKDFIFDPRNENYGTLAERKTALQKEIKEHLKKFVENRKSEYSKFKCRFYKKVSKRRDKKFRKKTYFTIESKYQFIISSLKNTTNGDMKKGPHIVGRKISWTIGANRGKATGFVDINAKYTSEYINKIVNDEVEKIKLRLNSKGIPTQ